MGPSSGPLPSWKGSEVWALGLCRVNTGYIRGPLVRAHIEGPCNYPRSFRLLPSCPKLKPPNALRPGSTGSLI